MNIIYWHGYYLKGTGSNIFTSNLVREMVKAGHNIYLFSQDQAIDFDFIDEYYLYDKDSQMAKVGVGKNQHTGKCIHIRTDIGGLLPVFVYDDYDGFQVKTFDTLTDSELEAYVSYNSASLRHILDTHAIDAVYSNHVAIAPYIMMKASGTHSIPFHVTCHGSALNYIVAKDERFLEMSRKGFEHTSKIIIPGNYILERFKEIYRSDFHKFKDKFLTLPPGVNVEIFSNPVGYDSFRKEIEKDCSSSKGMSSDIKEKLNRISCNTESLNGIKNEIASIRENYVYTDVDADLIEGLDKKFDLDGKVTITYLGKFIVSKGVHLFIMTLPYLFRKYGDELKIIIIGFGKLREALELLVYALKSNNRPLVNVLLKNLDYLENFNKDCGITTDINFFKPIIQNSIFDDYMELANNIILDNIVFTGLLDHRTIPYIISKSSILVIPSIFPESFGLVCVEAMASGTIPIVSNHSGLKEVVPFDELRIDLDENYIHNLTSTIEKYALVTELDPFRKQLVAESSKYSWESICLEYLRFID